MEDFPPKWTDSALFQWVYQLEEELREFSDKNDDPKLNNLLWRFHDTIYHMANLMYMQYKALERNWLADDIGREVEQLSINDLKRIKYVLKEKK